MNFQITAVALLSSTVTQFSWAMGSLIHLSIQKALDITFTAISMCSWEFRLSSVSHSDFPAQNSSSSSASFSLTSSCSSWSGTSSSCLLRTALLLNWPTVDNTLVLQQELSPVSCWTETCPQGSQLYPADPVATEITQTQAYKRITETGVKLHQKATITAKNFILILLQKQQAKGSAIWSELKMSAS